jgi:hypothetical protein
VVARAGGAARPPPPADEHPMIAVAPKTMMRNTRTKENTRAWEHSVTRAAEFSLNVPSASGSIGSAMISRGAVLQAHAASSWLRFRPAVSPA